MSKLMTTVSWSVPAILGACAATGIFELPAAKAQSSGDNVTYLNQAWSQDDREWYYHFSQGSVLLSYDIFLNLEVADGQDLFRSDANSERFGLIPEAASPYNPDGLPIGISRTPVATKVGDWPAGNYVGLTCAACHESQLEYKGKHVRIEGGAANHLDVAGYFQAGDAALQATLSDAAKYDRLAARAARRRRMPKRRCASGSRAKPRRFTIMSIGPYPHPSPGGLDEQTPSASSLTVSYQRYPASLRTGPHRSHRSSRRFCGMLRMDYGRSGLGRCGIRSPAISARPWAYSCRST